jgi:protein-tyrosine phosphatase
LHCNGGKGRSAVIAIAVLMVLRGWTKEQAFAYVLARRAIANLPRLGGIMPQWQVLAEFEATSS